MRILVAAVLSLLFPVGALAQSECEFWTPDLFPLLGASGPVHVLRVLDDGRGPALYVGGVFENALGSRGRDLVRFDGRRTTRLGTGFNSTASVTAIEGFDDGGGFRVFAGGRFRVAGGTSAENVARFDGTAWEACGAGFDGRVTDFAVHDDGSGPALFAAGSFTRSGARPLGGVARWTGTEWVPVGDGFDAAVADLEVFDGGSGPALHAIGSFSASGARPISRVARFDGTAWQPLGAGLDARGTGLAAFDDGSGSALFAVGTFLAAGGAPATRAARWDGTNWSAAGSGLAPSPLRAVVLDRGAGREELFAVGRFTGTGPSGVRLDCVARWTGAEWEDMGFGAAAATDSIETLAAFDDGTGPALFAGGEFALADGAPAMNLAKLAASGWASPVAGFAGDVLSFAAFDDGSGPALYIGSDPASAPRRTPLVARWDGSSLVSVADGSNGSVNALAVFDDGTGEALYAGGSFSSIGGTVAFDVAKWDGSEWSSFGPDGGILGFAVYAMSVFDDGSGPALYVGGSFEPAGGVPAPNLAKWDGVAWSAVGPGLTGGPVRALAVIDDGRGPALFVGGDFDRTGDGFNLEGLARWDGFSMTLAGLTYTGSTRAIAGFDDGTGVKIAVGGTIRASRVSGFAILEHGVWQSHGLSTTAEVRALAAVGPPGRERLVVGGSFVVTVAGATLARIALWDGAAWSTLDGGVSPEFGSDAVNALLPTRFAGVPALFAGGEFETAGGIVSQNVARYDMACSECPSGTVNAGAGDVTDVLFVNDSAGGPARRLTLATHDPIVAFLEAPPAAGAGAPYAMYLWRAAPGPTTARALPFGFGLTCLPTPLTGGAPAPVEIWNTTGSRRLGIATRSAPLAPAILFRLPNGAGAPATFYLQGIVADPGSAAERPASVTNGILVEVR